MAEEIPDKQLTEENTAEEITDGVCDYYAGLLQPPVSSLKELSEFHDVVEELLSKLDEMYNLLDMVRGESTPCLEKTIVEVADRAKEMELVFTKIDDLSKFVDIVRKNYETLHKEVEKAEKNIGKFSSVRKTFRSFPLFKKPSEEDAYVFTKPQVDDFTSYISREDGQQQTT